MPYHEDFGEIVEIGRIGAEELTVEWSIRKFLSQPSRSNDWYISNALRMGDLRCFLHLYPNHENEARSPASGWVDLGLSRADEGQPAILNASIGIRGSRGVEIVGEMEREFGGYCCWLFDDFRCSRSELEMQRSTLMPSDVLRITCVIKRVVPGAVRGVSSRASIENDSEIREHAAPDNGTQSSGRQGRQSSSDECIICLVKSINCAFNPCGHMSCCYECAVQVKERNSHCPICRESIQSILKIYKSV